MPLRNWQEMIDEAEKTAPLEFKALEPGDYDLIIEKAEHRVSQKGKDEYNVTARVESGPFANRKVFNTWYVSPESPTAMGIFFRQMGVLGLTKDFWNTNPSDDQICAALTGKRFIGTLKKSEYNGKERNEISNVATPRPLAEGVGPVVSGPSVAGGAPVPPTPAASPTPPVATPQPPAAAPAAPAAPANPWEATAAPTPPAANDPWGATPPPAPPVPGA